MSTKRSINKIVELQGVRYVQGIVQNHNSIFQRIDLENDQGNDCYIVFVVDGIATNYGVFVRIKSGESYKDANGYKIPADRAHLQYWVKPLYQTIGIVYDPDLNKAFWVDISKHLKSHPQVQAKNHHTIRVMEDNEFSSESFPLFIDYCFQYIDAFKSFENYGRSLDLFAQANNPELCYEGLKSLYSHHRDKTSAWSYIISNFGNIQREGIRRNNRLIK